MPISKRKKTIPSSARAWVDEVEERRDREESKVPEERKPRIGEMPSRLHKGGTSAVKLSKIRESIFAPDMKERRSRKAVTVVVVVDVKVEVRGVIMAEVGRGGRREESSRREDG